MTNVPPVKTNMKSLKLAPEEIDIITMLRRFPYQEIIVQVQDGVVSSVNQVLKYRRKKGGGLVFGVVNKLGVRPGSPLKLSQDEILAINHIRSKPYQTITVMIKDGIVEGFNKTEKFRKKK